MSIAQTTDAYISKMSEEQANVAACAHLVDAECKLGPSVHTTDNRLTYNFVDRQHTNDGVQHVQESVELLSIGR